MNQRDLILANLWCKHGCPEKMTVHVRKSGETITLINGLPVTDNAGKNPLLIRAFKAQKRQTLPTLPVTDNCVCRSCLKAFHSKRADAKYCSARCRQKAKREHILQRHRAERERLLAGVADDNPAA